MKFLNNLARLINVKSIVTIILTVIFSILSIRQVINAEQFISIFTVIIAFYFGTQYEKKNDNKKEGSDE